MQHPEHKFPPEKLPKVNAASLKTGYEPLSVNLRAMVLFVFLFLLTATVLHTDLWVLLNYYVWRPNPEDMPRSIAPAMATVPSPPVQPIPQHNNLPFQDLALLEDSAQRKFLNAGWAIDPATSQAIIPPDVLAKLKTRTRAAEMKEPARDPLFPPTFAPISAGPPEYPRRNSEIPPVEPEQAAHERIVYGEPPEPAAQVTATTQPSTQP